MSQEERAEQFVFRYVGFWGLVCLIGFLVFGWWSLLAWIGIAWGMFTFLGLLTGSGSGGSFNSHRSCSGK